MHVSSTIRVKCLDTSCLDNLDDQMVGMLALNTEEYELYAKFYQIDVSKHTQDFVSRVEWNVYSQTVVLVS